MGICTLPNSPQIICIQVLHHFHIQRDPVIQELLLKTASSPTFTENHILTELFSLNPVASDSLPRLVFPLANLAIH
jgi:hypothetical protein